jgi:hypothetical protein
VVFGQENHLTPRLPARFIARFRLAVALGYSVRRPGFNQRSPLITRFMLRWPYKLNTPRVISGLRVTPEYQVIEALFFSQLAIRELGFTFSSMLCLVVLQPRLGLWLPLALTCQLTFLPHYALGLPRAFLLNERSLPGF